MNNYTGTEPCAGCGKTGERAPRSRRNGICPDCIRLIELGRGVKENSDGFSKIKLARYSMSGIFLTDLREKEKTASIRHPGFAYVPDSDGKKGSSRHLLEALLALVETLDDGKKDCYEYQINMEESFPEAYSIRTKTALSIAELLDAVRLYGDRREDEGFGRGQQLLVRLCDGTISIDEFNKRSAGRLCAVAQE